MLFACCYRSSTYISSSEENNEKLNRFFRVISQKKYSHLCVVGDFNYRSINWITWTTNHGEESTEAKLIETIRDCYFYQHIEQVTRRRGNDNPSLIDLVFTDEEIQISDIQHIAPLGKSDHTLITFNFNCYLEYSKPKERYLYSKGGYDEMGKHLASLLRLEIWTMISTTLKSKLLELRDKYVPRQIITLKPSWKEKGCCPISKTTREAIKTKDKAHRQWMSAINRIDADDKHLRYTKARNKVKKLIRRDKRRFYESI